MRVASKKRAQPEPKALQNIIDAGRDTHQLGFGRAIEVWSAVADRPLEAAILVEDNARSDQACPGQPIRQPIGVAAELSSSSACEPPLVLGVTDGDLDEGRVAFGEAKRPCRGR